jgi:hypothetical protein
MCYKYVMNDDVLEKLQLVQAILGRITRAPSAIPPEEKPQVECELEAVISKAKGALHALRD